MTTDDLSSTLEEIRERRDRGRFSSSVRDIAASANDVPRLLAAMEAVLELHRPVDRGAGPHCKGCATHITMTPWPCPTYRAISRELTKGESDAR